MPNTKPLGDRQPATVYISNLSPDHDYTAAKNYGTLRPVTIGNFPIFKIGRLVEEIATALAASTPDDYLVLAGSSIVASLALAMWLHKHKSCQMLLYDRAAGKYTMRLVATEQFDGALEAAQDRAGSP